MIITKLNGGLGNQLFEYAYARSLQLKYNDNLYLDIEGFRRSPRHFSLQQFVLSPDVKVLPENKSRKLVLWQAISKYNCQLASTLAGWFHVYLWKSSVYKELKIGDTKRGKYYFYGYWQCEKYFAEHRDIIRKELRVKTEPIPEAVPYLEIAQQKETVCVHIRRGDYVDCGMLACSEEYYLKGMDMIREKHPDCKFLVFTDGIDWVRENIHFRHPITFVEIDNPGYEVLRIMYSCSHFVMSNSSFSWWAHYLSENPNKMVIAPSIWYPSMPNNKAIYMNNWIVIE